MKTYDSNGLTVYKIQNGRSRSAGELAIALFAFASMAYMVAMIGHQQVNPQHLMQNVFGFVFFYALLSHFAPAEYELRVDQFGITRETSWGTVKLNRFRSSAREMKIFGKVRGLWVHAKPWERSIFIRSYVPEYLEIKGRVLNPQESGSFVKA